MSKPQDSELLEILITGDEADRPLIDEGIPDYKHLISTFGSHTAARSSAGSARPSAKKGILKRGVALRRASSFSIGEGIDDCSCQVTTHWTVQYR